jgi:hypothetical protein
MNTRFPMHTWRRLLACLALNPKTKRHYRAMRYGRKSSAWQTVLEGSPVHGRQCWKEVQCMADLFWKRCRKEQTLAGKTKVRK